YLQLDAHSAAASLTVLGGAGNDKLESGTGNDTFNGGGGSDTADYRQATGNVSVNLNIAGPQDVGGGRGSDTLISGENIEGSSYDDTLSGDANSNVLNGGNGNDVLDGGDGNDVLYASAGTDVLNGGNGNDTASFANVAAPITVDLRSSSPMNGTTLISIE